MNGRMPKSAAIAVARDFERMREEVERRRLDVHALVPEARCPKCGAGAIVPLTPAERLKQPDDTTHVCHPSIGGCNRGFTDSRTREAPSTRELIERLGTAIKKHDKLTERPRREWVPSGGVCRPECDEPCEFHGGEQPCRSGKLVDVPAAQAAGGTGLCGGDCVLPAGHKGGCSIRPLKIEDEEAASEHLRNAIQMLRNLRADQERAHFFIAEDLETFDAIDRRLVSALAQLEHGGRS